MSQIAGATLAIITAVLSMSSPQRAHGQSMDIGTAPGRLVDVGGRRLHLHCIGTGGPTVIFEAGGSAFAVDWALVHPRIGQRARACAYDRARHGWSDPSPSAEMPANVVRDLHALLAAAGERPPYVLVGHSMGGIYARLFTKRYPQEVAALVLVDPSHEANLFTLYNGKPLPIASLTAEQLQATMPAGDISVPLRPVQTGAPFDRLPPENYRLRLELERRLIAGDSAQPVPRAIVAEAMEGQRAALAELQADAGLGDRPLVVLTRGVDSNEGLRAAHAALARGSTNNRHTIVADAGHEIQLYRPEVVIQAIEDVLEAVQQRSQLPRR